jgi:hypothetical protein
VKAGAGHARSPGVAPIAEPFTAAELRRDLAAVRDWSTAFWQGFGVDQFFAPLGDAWSPADNVRHLIKSNRPVAWALGLPRVLLLLRFGYGRRPSRSYSELVAYYHGALEDGLQAGRYAASPLPPERRTAEERERTIDRLAGTVTDVIAALARWPERSLDRLRLPHPGIGLLTVREMAFFTLYHNTHHVLGVARRVD